MLNLDDNIKGFKKKETKPSTVRLLFIMIIIFFVAGRIINQFYWLQITRHEELLKKARRRYTRTKSEKALRGVIYDKNGNILAGNYICYNVYSTPSRFLDYDLNATIERLSKLLNVKKLTLEHRFFSAIRRGKYSEVIVKRYVGIRKAYYLKSQKTLMKGLRLEKTSKRFYPKNKTLAHIIGYLSCDKYSPNIPRGQMGIEKAFEKELTPSEGKIIYERTGSGKVLYDATFQELKPSNGADIYLTIREPIQNIMDEELSKLVEKFQPKATYAVMANPKNGEIMAISQFPSFNLNNLKTATRNNIRNRILGDGFEPGSVMKGVSIAGAIDYGVVNLDSTFYCEKGAWLFSGKILHDSGHSYETLKVKEIIKKSSNIGTAKIAIKMGKTRLWNVLNRFGFGQKTGVELPGEATGIFRKKERWDGLSISRFPIGQGILVSPLQLIQAYCALANYGLMPQLHFVDKIKRNNTLIKTQKHKFKRRVIRKKSAYLITQALKTVTEKGGTGTKAAVKGYSVAGKTGTGQKFVNGAYSHSKYFSVFIGYVPADNPSMVLLVVADEPSKISHYGGTVCGPTFSRIAQRTLRYLQVAPKN